MATKTVISYRGLILLAVFVSAVWISRPITSAQAALTEAGDTDEWFEREVRPLLAERCQSCHSSTLQAPKGSLQLDKRHLALAGGDSGPAIEPGQPETSLIMQAVRGQGMSRMPPDKPLTQPEILTLERWIKLGAPWPQRQVNSPATGPEWLRERAQSHWAWQPMQTPASPAVGDRHWPKRPLDQLVLRKLETAQLQPAPDAIPTHLLRRLAYDLTGLPPAAADWLRFSALSQTANDQFEATFQATLERYLASPEFGATWGRHWFDLVRYCETLGHEFDYPVRYAWRYRDAVVDALNDDLPYDRFVREHIAGDLVTNARRHPTSGINQSLALTGWWWMGEGLHAPVDIWGDEASRLDNQIDVYSKTFMGLTVACARCHDHKFDPLSAADYTSLVGVLQSSRRTYALDDPHGHIAQHNQRLAEQIESSIRQACQTPATRVQTAELNSWLNQLADKWRLQADDARKHISIDHPLYPLMQLALESTSESWAVRRSATLQALEAADQAWHKWKSESVLLADFKDGLPPGWYVEAADPRVAELACQAGIDRTSSSNTDRQPLAWLPLDPVGVLPARPHHFASHTLGPEQQLALRSPTFEITHPLVAMRVRGKAVQSTVVVDNYFMIEFHTLLFGDLKKTIDQPHENGWIVHGGDLKKYLGHPAFLSIEDDEKGWFELSEIRLSDRAPPAEINPQVLEVVRASDSFDELVQRFAAVMLQPTLNATQQAQVGAGVPQADLPKCELLRSAIVEATRLQVALPAGVVPQIDRAALTSMAAKTPAGARVLGVHEGSPRDAAQLVRGNPHQRGAPVVRADLQALGGQPITNHTSSGRSELAHWLTQPQHPLTARVMVNRVWLQLFGQGLIDSPDNFGLLGGAPSNLELLDYLSLQFVEHDWSVKWLVREICSSRTYRLSSLPNAQQQQSDPTGRLLSHRQVRRLSAEKLRDAMLAISGSLDRAQGGESIPVHLTAQMTGRGRPGKSGPLDGQGRRTIYVELRRNFLDPFLVAFDQPPPATTVGKRNTSNVPAQALSMLNDPLVHELAGRWSARTCAQLADRDQRITDMYITALSRQPTAGELAACRKLVAENQVAQFQELAHVILCTKEFQYLP